jgi:hypothetical protein
MHWCMGCDYSQIMAIKEQPTASVRALGWSQKGLSDHRCVGVSVHRLPVRIQCRHCRDLGLGAARTRQCAMSASVCCRNSPRLAASASVEHSTSSTMSLITCAISHNKSRGLLMVFVGEVSRVAASKIKAEQSRNWFCPTDYRIAANRGFSIEVFFRVVTAG